MMIAAQVDIEVSVRTHLLIFQIRRGIESLQKTVAFVKQID
jgi:hypothetical protein